MSKNPKTFLGMWCITLLTSLMYFALPSPLISVFLRNSFSISLTLPRLVKGLWDAPLPTGQNRNKELQRTPSCETRSGGWLQCEPKCILFPVIVIPLLFHESTRSTSEISQTLATFESLTDFSTKCSLGPWHSRYLSCLLTVEGAISFTHKDLLHWPH